MGSDGLLKARRRRCGRATWAAAALGVAWVIAASVALSRPRDDDDEPSARLRRPRGGPPTAAPSPPAFALDASRWRLTAGGGASRAVAARWNATACRRVEPGPAARAYPAVLPKVATSGPRFVFFAGLEGTGHHFYGALALAANATALPRGVAARFGRAPHDRGLFGAGPAVTLAAAASDAAAAAAEIRALRGELGDAAVVAVNAADERPDGMFSYPNYGGDCKPLKLPDVRLLAEVFEAAGADLRVVALARDPLDVLASTTLRRTIQDDWAAAAALYADAAGALAAQLARLDPAFVACADYDALPRGLERAADHAGLPRRAVAAAARSAFRGRAPLAGLDALAGALARDPDAHARLDEATAALRASCGLGASARRRVEITQWNAPSNKNVKPLELGQTEADSAGFWTNRWLPSSSRSTAKDLASKRSHTRTFSSG